MPNPQNELKPDSGKLLSAVQDQVSVLRERLSRVKNFLASLALSSNDSKALMEKITTSQKNIAKAMQEGTDAYVSVKKDTGAYIGALSRYIDSIETQAKALTQPKKISRHRHFSPKIEKAVKPKKTTSRVRAHRK